MERQPAHEPTETVMRRARFRQQFVIAILLVATLMMATVPNAFASRTWCKTDPLIMVDGDLANIFVMSSLTAPLKVTGPTEIVVTVPQDANAMLILADLGFGRGQKVTFKKSADLEITDAGIEMQIAVRVPSRDNSMPVRVEFAPRVLGVLAPASVEGTANTWVVLNVVF